MSSALCFVKFGLFKKRRPSRAGCARMSGPDSALLHVLLRLLLGAHTLTGPHALPDAAFLLLASVILSLSTRLPHMENSVHCLLPVPSPSRSPRPDRPSPKRPWNPFSPSAVILVIISPQDNFNSPRLASLLHPVSPRILPRATARVNFLRHAAAPREQLS